jgi:hypothetical protein
MAIMVSDCPHCGVASMAFTVQGDYPFRHQESNRVVTGSCNACSKPLSVLLHHQGYSTWSPAKIQGDLLSGTPFEINDMWPAPEPVKAPDSVPDQIARGYVEAAESRQRKAWNAACAGYRRTMELALKAFAPDVEAWKLEKRIDKLAAEHRITLDMQDWAHELRLDGNEALHGTDDATEEIADQMHHLAHFLLVYLYQLPAQIEQARQRRNPSETPE